MALDILVPYSVPHCYRLLWLCRFVWVVTKGSASISDMASGMQDTRWELQCDTVQYSGQTF